MTGTLPLLHKQERRLIAEELRRRVAANGQSMAQFSIAFAAENPIDRVALTRALDIAVARHAALRTVIVPSPRYNEAIRQMQLQTFARTGLYIPGLYEQHPLEHAEVELPERAWSGDPEELEALTREECARFLDLSTAPALRAMLIAGKHQQLVIVNVSHLVLDLWAVTLLRSEVAHSYGASIAGTLRKLPPVLQQHDLVREELALLQSPEGERHLEYWTAHYDALDDAPIKASELPFVRLTSRPPTYEMLRLSLSDYDATQVHEACGRAPDYAFWRTMYGIALGILVNKTRVAFTANFLNRRRQGAQHALAWCAHPHMLRVEAPWSLPWVDVWRQVQSGVRHAQAHERYSWDAVALRLGRAIGSTDTHLTFDVIPGLATYDDTPLRPVAITNGLPAVDLGVRVHYADGAYTLVTTFNSGRYEPDGVSRLMTLMHDTIRACVAQPSAKVGDIVRTVRQRQRNAVAPAIAVSSHGADRSL
jgi:hypothetical protein